MKLKSLLLIDVVGKTTVKMKIQKGFMKDDLNDVVSLSKGWKPNDDGTDKLYFFPGCSVPRVKVREKYACTIKPSYGTAAFMSKEGLGSSVSLFEKTWIYHVTPKTIQPFIDGLKIENQHLKPMFDSLVKGGNMDYVGISDRALTYWTDDGYSQYSLNEVTKAKLYDIRSDSADHPEDFQFYHVPKNSQLAEINCKVYDEKELLGVLNEGKIVINETKYEELQMMGRSEDDLTLMMEMVANSNYAESLPNICFLLAEFKEGIHKKKKQKEQVNFRSLLVYLGIHPKDIENLSIGDFTQILKNKKQFTRTNAFRLSQFYADMPESDFKNSKNQMWTPGPVLKPNYVETDN